METVVVKTGTAVILVKGNRLAVGKRKGSHGEGIDAFPGGHIDPTDTSLKQAGEREVMEEMGIVCDIRKIDGIRDDVFTTFDILSEDGTKRYVTTYLLAHYVSGGKWLDDNTVEGLEPDKCEVWDFVTLPKLVASVQESGDRAWIPLDKVVPYLEQLFGEKIETDGKGFLGEKNDDQVNKG